ncbi:MAG: superoxide dismutase [Ni], partial [Pseudomonadota bacterium]|nr:superoxide dismutase [Ni] [Pseudomonadota bacterium]
MIHQLLSKLHAVSPFPAVSAHCDIPCKIYDPFSAQLAALSVIRFVDLLNELA